MGDGHFSDCDTCSGYAAHKRSGADTKTDTKRLKNDRPGYSRHCLNRQQNQAYLKRNGGKIRPIPSPATTLNCGCSKQLGGWRIQTDTKTDTNFPIRE